MLTIETLIKFLNIEQKQLSKLYDNTDNNDKTDNYNETNLLPEIFKQNISDEFSNYYYIQNCSNFLHAIFHCIDKDFVVELDKNKYIVEARKIMSYDLIGKDLYKKFGYNKIRKIKKDDLQKNLMKFDNELDEYLRQYVSDYFGINIFIFTLLDDDHISNISYIFSKNDTDDINWYKSTVLLINRDEKWMPILNKFDNNILVYSESGIIKELQSNYNGIPIISSKKIELKSFKKMLLKDLQNLAQEYGVDIMRNNGTNYKNKTELYNELKML